MKQSPMIGLFSAVLLLTLYILAEPSAPFNMLPAQPTGAVQDVEEYFYLDNLASPDQWAPAESEARSADEVNGHPALTFHVDVDHHAGEPKYPIGWPRMYARKPNDFPWKDFDKFEFKIFTKTSSNVIPARAFAFRFAGKPKINIEIGFGSNQLKLNDWTTFSMPLAKVAEATSLSTCGFYISESNYPDKEILDFTFAEIRLVRSSYCKITEMETQGVRYNTSPTLPVKITVFGPASDCARGVPFQIAQGEKVLRLETLPVVRGNQTLLMDISELNLANGDYTLTAFPDNPDRKLTVSFKVIESPF
ncbi:MAG: hypothetical protein IKP00_11135 [Victivallales bacterium]|nr:hypothetical protein [Victivallales bacterium]